jgi:plasmid stabilization system protein ParE
VTVDVRFVDEAVKELEDAAHWYEDRSEGLGLVLVAALDRTVESIMRWPHAAALVEGVSEELLVRRVAIRRFPYFVAYLMADETVVVLAVAHERRRPRYWIDRVGS